MRGRREERIGEERLVQVLFSVIIPLANLIFSPFPKYLLRHFYVQNCNKVLIYHDEFVRVCPCGLLGKTTKKIDCSVYGEECMS